jgi:Uma2 family endonuclease
MSAIKNRRMTEDEYLVMERAAETKSEFYSGEVVAMAGASLFHNAVKDNLIGLLHSRLQGTGCRTFSSDMKVWSPRTHQYTYPDIVIICGKPEFKDEKTDILLNPKVVIEVLSPSTEVRDRTTKFKGLILLDSVQEYILVSQNDPFIERMVRDRNSDWKLTPFIGLESDFELATLPVKIPMAEIYHDVEFPDAAGSES